MFATAAGGSQGKERNSKKNQEVETSSRWVGMGDFLNIGRRRWTSVEDSSAQFSFSFGMLGPFICVSCFSCEDGGGGLRKQRRMRVVQHRLHSFPLISFVGVCR